MPGQLCVTATDPADRELLVAALALADGVWLRAGAEVRNREGATSQRPPRGATELVPGPPADGDAAVVFVAASAADAAPAGGAGVLRVERAALLADPAGELRRICAFAGIAYDQALLTPIESAARARGGAGAASLASVSTGSFATALAEAGSSLLVSTYQTNKLVCARVPPDGGGLNTHFRDVDKPMGIAVAPGRLALGTRTEVWDLRDMPEAAAAIAPRGLHDACYLPRNRHVTGDIAVHELGFAGGRLWLVATAFSCLATLDADHSFVPQWAPPFISALAPEDRCHLNGMAIVDDRVAFVTALGRTDEPHGWRAGKAAGGVLLDVPSGEVVAQGLSMPHSPRWHDGRVWLLESGRGTLATVDVASGAVQTVVELPGFTRGLAFLGHLAFVGLSQVRESSTFGDLPLTRRLRERRCGVWMIDLRAGEVAGFLRFEDLVQEIFDVAVLAGTRFPEIAEAAGETIATSFALP